MGIPCGHQQSRPPSRPLQVPIRGPRPTRAGRPRRDAIAVVRGVLPQFEVVRGASPDRSFGRRYLLVGLIALRATVEYLGQGQSWAKGWLKVRTAVTTDSVPLPKGAIGRTSIAPPGSRCKLDSEVEVVGLGHRGVEAHQHRQGSATLHPIVV